jgi:large subunit ribosomal protein L3
VDIFEGVSRVDVVGTSKGKGFQGVMRRHGFRGGRATHGSMFHRAPGSIGQSAFPSRVLRGMRAAGHMGHRRVTVKNLDVVRIDRERNLLLVRGAVPGARGSTLLIHRAKLAKPARTD